MQGTYTDLLMEQIKNSQEKDQIVDEPSASNTMVLST